MYDFVLRLPSDGQSDVWTEGRQTEGQTDVQSSCERFGQCQTHRLVVKRGSSVLLPCNLSSPTPSNVSWVKVHETLLVHISSEGHVGFVEHREGRMKTFPNGAAEGNFSIRVDQLRPSDLGWYCCQHGQRCVQVHLQESSECSVFCPSSSSSSRNQWSEFQFQVRSDSTPPHFFF